MKDLKDEVKRYESKGNYDGTLANLFGKTNDTTAHEDEGRRLRCLLEPKTFDTLYHKVHCKNPECQGANTCPHARYVEKFDQDSGFGGGRFRSQKQIAQYYNEMLLLVAEQCADRSNNCIRHFQLQYSFELVFTGLSNSALPPLLRTSFARLMTHLYIDRYPHDKVLSVDHSTYFEHEIEDLSEVGILQGD